MGKGIIKSGGADGFYNIELTFERERVVKTITNIDSQIDSLTEIIDATEDGNVKELIKLERNSYIKRKEYLQNNMPEDTTVSAWCADLTEDLTGNIGTIEVPGERGIVQIQPGHEGNSIYDATRDGQLQPSIAGTPAATFYNLAMLPGWQKWKPTFRYGIISNINTEANTCNVKLDVVESSQQNLDINQKIDLTGISISYMNCDSTAFDDGDNVLVKFEGQSWNGAQVIGFKDNPKACEKLLIILICGSYRTVWDVASESLATGVTNNNGDPVSFPVLASDITDWVATKTDVYLNDLYSVETESDTGPIPPDSGSEDYDSYDYPCSGGYSSESDYAWTGVLGGDNHVLTEAYHDWVNWCPDGGGMGTKYSYGESSYSYMRHSGTKLTAENDSDDELKFYKSVSTERSQMGENNHESACTSCTNMWSETCISSDATNDEILTVLSHADYGLDLGVSSLVTTYDHVSCVGGTWNYDGDKPILKSVNLSYSAVYSEDYKGAMIQIFSANDNRGNYSFYGQAESGIFDISTQNPTELNETTPLSYEMQALSDIVGGSYIYVSYCK